MEREDCVGGDDAKIALRPVERRWIREASAHKVTVGELSEDQVGSWIAQAEMRFLSGEPLQYILGRWSFRHIELTTDPRALIPRPETEQLVELVVDRFSGQNRSLCGIEVGVGTGAISLSLASEIPRLEMVGDDLSRDALSLANENLQVVELAIGSSVRFIEGSLFEPFDPNTIERANFVISNPPYLSEALYSSAAPTVRSYEPRLALTPGGDGLSILFDLLYHGRRLLRSGTVFFLEHSPEQAAPLQRYAGELGMVEISVESDLSGRPRYLVCRRG